MFEKELKAILARIFDFQNTSFDDSSEQYEQEKLFIQVDAARSDITEARQKCLVRGTAYVYANSDKLPFGYFAKRIERASVTDRAKFFFSEIDRNERMTNNIVRRSVGFVFFFDAQYDPRVGIINEVNIDVEDE